jgi:hypothetical protein
MSMPLDDNSHRSATASYRNSDDLEPVRQAAWQSIDAIDEAAEEVRAIVATNLTPTDSTIERWIAPAEGEGCNCKAQVGLCRRNGHQGQHDDQGRR